MKNDLCKNVICVSQELETGTKQTKRIIKMKKSNLILAVALIIGCLNSANAAPLFTFTDNFEGYGTGNINATTATDYGWYGQNVDTVNNLIYVVDGVNSPWDGGGSKSVKMHKSSGDISKYIYLYNYFTDQLGLGVTGSVGSPLSGTNLRFSWDVLVEDFARQPLWEILDSSSKAAIGFQVRWDTKYLRYTENGTVVDHTGYAFENNTWYRFELSKVNTDAKTYDLDVFAWGQADSVISLSGLSFAVLAVTELDHFKMRSNSTGNYLYHIDNFQFQVIPEPSSLMLLGPAGLALLRRRRR